jgi:hypothetical protein
MCKGNILYLLSSSSSALPLHVVIPMLGTRSMVNCIVPRRIYGEYTSWQKDFCCTFTVVKSSETRHVAKLRLAVLALLALTSVKFQGLARPFRVRVCSLAPTLVGAGSGVVIISNGIRPCI